MIMVGAHRAEKDYEVGKIDPNLGQESSFLGVTEHFWNSLGKYHSSFRNVHRCEILAGYSSFKLGIVVWIYAISRIIHMLLYYYIATEKNPSPRSYFYGFGLIATLYLLVDLESSDILDSLTINHESF